MPMQKVEFTFPDEESDEIEVESSSASDPFEKPAPEKEPEAKEEFEVEVVDDTPQVDRGRKPSDPPEDITEGELDEYSDKVKKRIKHFSKGYHDERRAKETAQREREEAVRLAKQIMDENNRLKSTVGESKSAMFEHAKTTVARDHALAKKEYKEAYEAGNADAILAANEKVNTAQYRIEQLRTMDKQAGQRRPDAVQQEQQVTPQAEPQPQQVDGRAQEWANQNKWFGKDQEMTALALGYHTKLVENGTDPTSDEYYEKLNSRMHQVFPEEFGDGEPPSQGEPRQKSQVVAPATRSTTPKKVKLTQTQVALAKRLGIPIEEYAKQVAIEMRKANNG